MALALWRPLREVSPFRREVGSLFDSLFDTPFFDVRATGWVPPMSVYENEESIKVEVELPGVDQKDVSITYTEGNLLIKGEKKSSREQKDELQYCSERCYGVFERILRVPTSVDGEKISARYEQGVLQVTLPKLEESKPKEVKIKIK